MLSRVAQAPRLGLLAARLSRPVASPVLRPRQTPITSSSQWVRAYSKEKDGKRQPLVNDKSSNQAPSSQNSTPRPDAESAQETAKPEPNQDADGATEGEQIRFDKLPDLTQGIPSTLEYELGGKKAGKSDSALQEVEEDESGERGGRDRAEYVSTTERNRKWWTRVLLSSTAVASTLGLLYMGRDWDDVIEANRHPDIPNGFSPVLWWKRSRARMTESVSYYKDPAFEKLLPDPDPSFERPYTLCLSLDDLLVHSEWSREHGWRVAKRPGMDYFVRYLSQYYELVLFTTVPMMNGEPVMRKLDPFRFIMWPLYREATKYEDGEIVKDLGYLNRDLSKVIILDTNPTHVRKHPENAIILKPWKGDPTDKDLVGLIPFLEYIHTVQYSDVRKVLKSFDGKHIPTEFARREAIARKEFNEQMAEKAKHKKPSGMGALGNMLGLKPSNMSMTVAAEGETNPSEAFAQGKMLQDIARERGQRNYEMMEREIRQNGEKWLKEEQQMMEKLNQEAMQNMMGSFSGWFTSGKNNNAGSEKKA